MKHTFLTFDLLAGGQYPIEVKLPDGTVRNGTAICNENIISSGSRLYPGFTDIIIDDLTHFDEIGEDVSHDVAVSIICYAINEGSVERDSFDSGLSFTLSDISESERENLSH